MCWNCVSVCDLKFLRILEIKLSRKKYTCQESPKKLFIISEKKYRKVFFIRDDQNKLHFVDQCILGGSH